MISSYSRIDFYLNKKYEVISLPETISGMIEAYINNDDVYCIFQGKKYYTDKLLCFITDICLPKTKPVLNATDNLKYVLDNSNKVVSADKIENWTKFLGLISGSFKTVELISKIMKSKIDDEFDLDYYNELDMCGKCLYNIIDIKYLERDNVRKLNVNE